MLLAAKNVLTVGAVNEVLLYRPQLSGNNLILVAGAHWMMVELNQTLLEVVNPIWVCDTDDNDNMIIHLKVVLQCLLQMLQEP